MNLNWLRFWLWCSVGGVLLNAYTTAYDTDWCLQLAAFAAMLLCVFNATQFNKFIREKKHGKD